MSYVVGGPWKNSRLQQVSLSNNIPAEQTAGLYQQTRLVVNVFRDVHHFNREAIPGWSMNPRIYEALACGALVLSQQRPEVEQEFPELPVFNSDDELVESMREMLGDDAKCDRLLWQCQKRLFTHSYANRLRTILAISLGERAESEVREAVSMAEVNKISVSDRIQCVNSTITDSDATNGIYGPVHAISAGLGENLPVKPLPFTGMPVRNLIYHIWPVKGAMWQWNLDQLKKRIDIFNGRRIIAIVFDDTSDDPETVKKYLEGHGCEFVVEPNSASGECITFPLMLREVASLDPNEVTFYAHGKGVKYGAEVPWPVRRWVEVQYRTCLDNWTRTWKELQQFAMTGPFKRLGRYQTHKNLGDWHYCGTFFWMRHAQVFTRDCFNIPDFYGGVEAWPGIYFRETETGCLFLNTQRQAPYLPQFWQSIAEPALKRWESSLELVSVPSDLANPLPIDGYGVPRTEQKAAELDWWIRQLLEADVRSLLTIGAAEGGVEWHIARVFREHQRDIEITAIEMKPDSNLKQTLQDVRDQYDQTVYLIEGDSASEAVKCQLRDHYDAVFIDSDHGYSGVRNDWLLAKQLTARLVGFHDIVDSNWHAQNKCCVSRLWLELKAEYKTDERSSGEWGGIGVVSLQ